jgi:membrane-bound lytic murein transglycosylase A
MRNKTLLLPLILSAGLIPACAPRSYVRPLPAAVPTEALRVVPPEEIPDFTDDMDDASLDGALKRSLAYYGAIPGSAKAFFGQDSYTVSSLRRSLKKFRRLIHRFKSAAERQAAIQKQFVVYQSTGASPGGRVIFSAYYEPTLPASLTPHGKYAYPLYAKPADLDEAKPYHTREEIDSKKALAGKNLEIAWARDPFDIYLLQVEGTGWLILENNERVRVRYAGSNNRPYRSIGLALIKQGLMTSREISAKGIRSTLNAHLGERQKILNTNPRYIFFRFDRSREARWALGSLYVPLTPGRSVATDPALFPRGALGWIKTELPTLDEKGEITGKKPFSRFVLNQDEGGAIKGAGRLDLFVGGAEDAARFAGHFWQAGKLYFLVERK